MVVATIPVDAPYAVRTVAGRARVAQARAGGGARRHEPGTEMSRGRPSGAPRGPAVGDLPSSPITAQVREQFVRRLSAEHGQVLLSFLLRLTGGDWHWAEDVRQETLLRAWRCADQLLTGGAPTMLPWLITVARHLVINDRRRRRARPHEVDDCALQFVSVPDDTDRALQRTILSDALGRIGKVHRQVIVEIYFRGRTVEEAARSLGIPIGTAKSRCFYAIRALREVLRELGVEP
jgi:RNA polymerase sigma-70 factor (ECF subfamily)